MSKSLVRKINNSINVFQDYFCYSISIVNTYAQFIYAVIKSQSYLIKKLILKIVNDKYLSRSSRRFLYLI